MEIKEKVVFVLTRLKKKKDIVQITQNNDSDRLDNQMCLSLQHHITSQTLKCSIWMFMAVE